MSVLKVDTDQVRDTARRFRWQADQLYEQAVRLRRASAQLDWTSTSTDWFVGEIRTLAHRLENQSEMLNLLAARLDREAEEWEQIDAFGASNFYGISALISVPRESLKINP